MTGQVKAYPWSVVSWSDSSVFGSQNTVTFKFFAVAGPHSLLPSFQGRTPYAILGLRGIELIDFLLLFSTDLLTAALQVGGLADLLS